MKTKIRVFPDYMACALWQHPDQGHCNLEYEMFEDVIPKPILIALKYWVTTWEKYEDCRGTGTMSASFRAEWNQDGIALTEAMNACQDKYEFIYIEEKYREHVWQQN